MTRSAGGPHNSLQPIIQMGDCYSDPIPTSSSALSLGRVNRLAFISHVRGQPDVSSVVCAALREKGEAFQKTTQKLLTTAERIRCYHGGNDGRVARAEQAERTGLSVPVTHTHTSLPL